MGLNQSLNWERCLAGPRLSPCLGVASSGRPELTDAVLVGGGPAAALRCSAGGSRTKQSELTTDEVYSWGEGSKACVRVVSPFATIENLPYR